MVKVDAGKSTVARMIAGIAYLFPGEEKAAGRGKLVNTKGSEKERFRQNIQMVFPGSFKSSVFQSK